MRAAMRVGATFGYLDVVFSGKHIFNVYSKKDTFIVKGVNADLRHYISTLAYRGRCFPWRQENRQAALLLSLLRRITVSADIKRLPLPASFIFFSFLPL